MPRTKRASRSTTRSTLYEPHEQNSLTRTTPYAPIDSENGDIRLLELAPGSFEDEIQMRLIPANLNNDSDPQYEALSYVWGTEMTSRKAMNQKDTQERNHQVQIMGKIYSTASNVIVWLGPVDQSDIHLRVVLGAMQFHFSNQNPSTVTLFDYACSVVTLLNERTEVAEDAKECVLDAIFCIVDRPWFTRIWVVQELALLGAARICIGNHLFPWRPFEYFVRWLPRHKVDPKQRPDFVEAFTRVAKASRGH